MIRRFSIHDKPITYCHHALLAMQRVIDFVVTGQMEILCFSVFLLRNTF